MCDRLAESEYDQALREVLEQPAMRRHFLIDEDGTVHSTRRISPAPVHKNIPGPRSYSINNKENVNKHDNK